VKNAQILRGYLIFLGSIMIPSCCPVRGIILVESFKIKFIIALLRAKYQVIKPLTGLNVVLIFLFLPILCP
jgi:hypothetical protein